MRWKNSHLQAEKVDIALRGRSGNVPPAIFSGGCIAEFTKFVAAEAARGKPLVECAGLAGKSG